MVIVGTGGQAREIHATVEALIAAGEAWNVVGFVDDASGGNQVHELPVLGPVQWLSDHGEVEIAVGIRATSARTREIGRAHV